MMTHTPTISIHSSFFTHSLSLHGLKPHLNAPLKGTWAWDYSTFYPSNSPHPFIPVQPLSFLSLSLLFTVSFSLSLYLYIPLLSQETHQGEKEKMSPAGSSRWSPTTEQLMILEELYRSGIRTPSASQIQQITTHLSFYGRIEGKNVFYWFQNHKARDRQKLRRKLTKQLQLQQQQLQLHHCHLNTDITNHYAGTFAYTPSSSTQDFPFYTPPTFLFQVIFPFPPCMLLYYS